MWNNQFIKGKDFGSCPFAFYGVVRDCNSPVKVGNKREKTCLKHG